MNCQFHFWRAQRNYLTDNKIAPNG